MAVEIMTVKIASIKRKCVECGRVFDMGNATDAEEWAYGHDCEPQDEQGAQIRERVADAQERGGWSSYAEFEADFEDRDPFEFL